MADLLYLGIIVFQIGVEVKQTYDESKSSSRSHTSAQAAQNNNYSEEVKQEEQVVYELDPNMDINSLTCPITMVTIVEPAATIYGHLFELSAIQQWVRMRGECPLTKKPLREDQIYPQYGLKDTIAEMKRIKKEN